MRNQENDRPDPDELLKSIKTDELKNDRGKLKIFFGMCAGVGKTYSMLRAAHSEKEKGVDVVAGYVETHRRIETEQLLRGLEIIPCIEIRYRDTTIKEPDIDAIIKRNPRIVLIDELAHSNAPGSRHAKRYQDVLDLLDKGIDVYTTLNVQHLESRTDVVSQITGIIVRETIPDEIFEIADDVELVDISPDELLVRLAEGKVYTRERSVEAVHNFFRKGNITALREMALRIMADRVDKQLRQYMQQKRIPGPWKSGLHLMAVISHSAQSAKLLRWAKNLSYTMGATILALHVEPSRKLSEQQREQLSKNIKLARQLGFEFIKTSGDDPVKAILNIAKKENTTHIVIGKPRHRTLMSLIRLGNFVNRLIRHSGNIDVYVLGSDIPEEKKIFRFVAMPSFTSGPFQYIISGIIITLTTALFFMLSGFLDYQLVAYAYLFILAIMATFLGIGPILLAASLSALMWDYFFIPPVFTFHVGNPEDILILLMYFFIALVNGILTTRVRRQERLSRVRENQTNSLYRLTKELTAASQIEKICNISTFSISRFFGFDCAILLADEMGQILPDTKGSRQIKLNKSDLSIAQWVFEHSKKAGKYTETLPSTDYTFYALNTGKYKLGVVTARLNKPMHPEGEVIFEAFLTQITNSLEREYLNDLARKGFLFEESDKLYKTLFNSISHELRIPVSAIISASELLATTEYNKEANARLYEEINAASYRLNRLIENLLNMSRLETGRISPHLDWHDISELIKKVCGDLKSELSNFNVDIVIQENIPLVRVDYGLMEEVLFNLILNATQYATKSTTIRIKAFFDTPNLVLQIMDRGPGFPTEGISKAFDKFYRVEGTVSGGTGLGLSIVKGFVEAHGGTVTLQNRKNSGAFITVKIPSPLPQFDKIAQND